jgi:hypothetical protein
VFRAGKKFSSLVENIGTIPGDEAVTLGQRQPSGDVLRDIPN